MDPLWERLLVAATGPAVTVLFGTLLVGLYLARKSERDARESARENDRRQFDFRQALVEAMTKTALELRFGLVAQRKGIAENEAVQAQSSLDLDRLFRTKRGELAAIATRLKAHYASAEVRQEWHHIVDLLTVRYFQLIGKATPELYIANAGPSHSGLTVEELRSPENIYRAVDDFLDRATEMVVREALILPQ